MNRYYYSKTIAEFLSDSKNEIIGILTDSNEFSLEQTQKNAWSTQIDILKSILNKESGQIVFEFSIPRMGRRIDNVLIIKNVIFVLEFKVGEKEYLNSSIDQVWDYALDLKNFHENSHSHFIAPILIATEAKVSSNIISLQKRHDNVFDPIKSNKKTLLSTIESILNFSDGANVDIKNWDKGKYKPTPTIIEAAMSLYNNHKVEDIDRNDAHAKNLAQTSGSLLSIIQGSKEKKRKSICFVTGVPGAGKTLIGLKIATDKSKTDKNSNNVFLSGNGPLVAVLRAALTRDKVRREKEQGKKITKSDALREVSLFIQNVHNFRDESLAKEDSPPHEHVAIFDEAQRAWDLQQTIKFMQQKKGKPNFKQSEPEFLISCLDRHNDWAVIVCLVGGGQEINTGEAGISEWIDALNRSFPNWDVYISDKLIDQEYNAIESLRILKNKIFKINHLHLSVSMRSFRAENVASFVKHILDLNKFEAIKEYQQVKLKYPILLTRNLDSAKKWLRSKARGSERYGIVVSSQAQRLKPFAIDVKTQIDPVHWFLDDKQDVRSSFFLEDVATEFQVQGLELDWVCVTWDADFRFSNSEWTTHSFVGDKWQNIKKEERKQYLKNAYRVLLTRGRQGMVIVVPNGEIDDQTRNPKFYDCTYNYLKEIGIEILE